MKKKLILGIALLVLAGILTGTSCYINQPAGGYVLLLATVIFIAGIIIMLLSIPKGKKILLITGSLILVAS